MKDWQPIEAAPRDGQSLILYSVELGICIGRFSKRGCWAAQPGTLRTLCTPITATHWQPLPPKPGETKGEDRTKTGGDANRIKAAAQLAGQQSA